MDVLVKIFNAICFLPLVIFFGMNLHNDFNFSSNLCIIISAIIWTVVVLLLDIRDSLSKISGKSK